MLYTGSLLGLIGPEAKDLEREAGEDLETEVPRFLEPGDLRSKCQPAGRLLFEILPPGT